MKFHISLMALLSLLAFLLPVKTRADVYSEQSAETMVVKVSRGSTKDKLVFELCQRERPDLCDRVLGGREFTVEELKLKKMKLVGGSLGSLTLGIGVLAAIPLAGAGLGALVGAIIGDILLATGASNMSFILWGGLAGFGGGLLADIGYFADKFSPVKKFKTSKLVGNDVLKDKNMYIMGSIEHYAYDLDEVLRDI